jgi:hypothetical protein
MQNHHQAFERNILNTTVNVFFVIISGRPFFLVMPGPRQFVLMCVIWLFNSCNCISMLKTHFRVFRKAAKSTYELLHIRPSVCTHGTTYHLLDGFSRKIALWAFYRNIFRKIKFGSNPTLITDSLHGDVREFYYNTTLYRKSKPTCAGRKCLSENRVFYEIIAIKATDRHRSVTVLSIYICFL